MPTALVEVCTQYKADDGTDSGTTGRVAPCHHFGSGLPGLAKSGLPELGNRVPAITGQGPWVD